MRFDWCKTNLKIGCGEYKYDHCEMCNIARAYQHGYETAQEDMSKDAIEVVRCKDCKHYSVKGKTTQFGFCGYRHAGTDETDYCSRAVRREE